MSADQVQYTLFGIAGIIMGGVCLCGIGSKVVSEVFKTRRKALAKKNEFEEKISEAIELSNAATERLQRMASEYEERTGTKENKTPPGTPWPDPLTIP